MTASRRLAVLISLLTALGANAEDAEKFSDAPLLAADGEVVPQVEANGGVDPSQTDPRFGLFVSPVSTLMLAFVLELEVKVGDPVTLYATGEYYGLWNGWAAQAGARAYFINKPFNGGFIDVHARANNLYLVNLIGGGLEVGGEHSIKQSHFTAMWSVGCDIGYGKWSPASTSDTFEVVHAAMAPQGTGSYGQYGLTAMPKVRFMLGYTF